MAHRFGLSKSKIVAFEQCPKRLWLQVHRPELAEQSEGAEARFAIGHQVGAIACALLPDGVMVEAAPDIAAALATTRTLLEGGWDRPIFEATLVHDGVLVRVDILEPDGDGGWKMAEVKSTASVKTYQYDDVATQLWVANNAGVTISEAVVRHIDTRFVLEREGDFRGLFIDTDVLPVAETMAFVRDQVVDVARETLAGPEPDIAPGPQCSDPFDCEFAAYCSKGLPPGPEWPVTVLPNGGGKRWIALGTDDLLAVNREALTNPLHLRVRDATASGEVFHDVEAARAGMAAWAFPRTWLDFETVGFAVPRWIGTRPFQQVPFQFSAHIEAADGSIEHREFLSLDGCDPRRRCADALVASIPQDGQVIAYYASFERARILELAGAFPDLSERLRAIGDRIVDLLPVARANWYHRDQRGSWSIKAVLPTIAPELDYADLEVAGGLAAQEAYIEAIAPATGDERREALAADLKTYCERDTWAMIVLARRLTDTA